MPTPCKAETMGTVQWNRMYSVTAGECRIFAVGVIISAPLNFELSPYILGECQVPLQTSSVDCIVPPQHILEDGMWRHESNGILLAQKCTVMSNVSTEQYELCFMEGGSHVKYLKEKCIMSSEFVGILLTCIMFFIVGEVRLLHPRPETRQFTLSDCRNHSTEMTVRDTVSVLTGVSKASQQSQNKRKGRTFGYGELAYDFRPNIVPMGQNAVVSKLVSTANDKAKLWPLFEVKPEHVSVPYVTAYPLSSLTDYVNRVQTEGNISFDEEMCYEVRRLQSFNGCQILASPMRLAQSGFHATGDGDGTQCYSCGKTYRNWKLMDKPDVIHRIISPDCTHLNGMDTRNISMRSASIRENVPDVCSIVEIYPMFTGRHDVPGPTSVASGEASASASAMTTSSSTESLDISRAVYPSYKDLHSRLDSYHGWGWSHVQNPQVLARAGFYYAGYRDCVRCFYCGVGLRTWEKEDDPWMEHVRWRSSCDYVQCVRGEQFIIETLAVGGTSGSELTLPRVTAAQDSQRRDIVSDVTTRAQAMGFQREEIESAANELIRCQEDLHRSRETTYQNESNGLRLEELLEKLVLGNASNSGCVTHSTPAYQPSSTNADVSRESLSAAGRTEPNDETKVIINGPTVSSSPTRVTSDTCRKYHEEIQNPVPDQKSSLQRQLEEENQSLRDESTCKVCLDNPSCIVFLPCGHLVTCAECAPALHKCPVCRAVIRGTVRAYNV